MKPIQVFIGYDPNETISYHVLAHSILSRASRPVSITPLKLSQLGGMYARVRHPQQSTEFTFSRFLAPYLAGGGISIFLDSDMLCLGDISRLAEIAASDPYKDVFVVKHDYTPSTTTKFLRQVQTAYPCKNWSSLMVFNGHRMGTKSLTPEYVNSASPMELHQFLWSRDIGELPSEWNHLVGEYAPNPEAKLVHFTLGGPWFPEYDNCEFATEWHDEAHAMIHPVRSI